MSWIGKKERDAGTVNVAVIYRLSTTPLMGTVVEPFKSNVYLHDEWLESGVWSRLSTKSSGISFSETNLEMKSWNENFYSSKNFSQRSTFLVVLFLFIQSIFFKTLRAQPSVSLRLPRKSCVCTTKRKMSSYNNYVLR